jgi:hypothetical protein
VTAKPQPRSRKLGAWFAIGVLVAFVTNPSEARHLAAMREHASWEAPYSITEAQLRSAHFQYRSYLLFSVTRLSDGVYTYGFFGMVTPTNQLRPKLVELYVAPREEKK